jgi:hypothetical protein
MDGLMKKYSQKLSNPLIQQVAYNIEFETSALIGDLSS